MRFEVWAPFPGQVDLLLDDRRIPMARDEQGWWSVEEDAAPGDRYGFSCDGGPLRPDPRAAHQPDGIGQPSAVYDHDAFVWHDERWGGLTLAGAVLYELHVGTFSRAGTFDGAIEQIAHLAELGVDAVELLPVATASGQRGWGYDGVDLFAPHPAYGGPDGLKRFVDACHGAGIGVIIDVVYNHLGPAGCHLAELGPYFTDRHTTFWGDAIDYDGPHAAEVRRLVVDNARSWLRHFHGDGLRLDAVHAIVDDSARHVVAELGEAVAELAEALDRPLFVIAESDLNDPVLVRPRPEGFGLDAAWADDWHHAVHAVLTGETTGYYEDFGSLDELVKALEQAWVYDGAWSRHRNRPHGFPVDGLAADRFVVAVQNHDQVGNRAAGERLASLTSWGRLHIAAAWLLTSPFVPMLFQGEEWGASTPFQYFTDHPDPDLARSVSEGRRREFAAFGWAPEAVPDPQARATFERSVLVWEEARRPPHEALLRWHRDLIALRRTLADLHDPAVTAAASHDEGLVVVARGSVQVVANLDAQPRELGLPTGTRLLMASDPGVQVGVDGVRVPVDSVVLLRTPEEPAER